MVDGRLGSFDGGGDESLRECVRVRMWVMGNGFVRFFFVPFYVEDVGSECCAVGFVGEPMVRQTVPGLQRFSDDRLSLETRASTCADNAESAMRPQIGSY